MPLSFYLFTMIHAADCRLASGPFAGMSREVRARVGTARLLLAGLDGVGHAAASKTQAAALVATIKQQASLCIEERADISALVAEVRWAAGDVDAIMQALSSDEAALAAKSRHAMQSYVDLLDYFTAEEWSVLLNSAATMCHKREVLFTRAAKLGLRAPSESTAKWLTSLLLLLCEPKDALQAMASPLKHDVMKSLKSAFKAYIRKLPNPIEFITRLPPTPALLKQSHPAVYESAYCHGEAPVASKVDYKEVSFVDMSFRCREGGMPTQLQPRSLSFSSSSTDQLTRFASGVMESMMQMQQQQHHMMSFITGGSASVGNKRPLSLGALTDDDDGCQLRLLASKRPMLQVNALINRAPSLQLDSGTAASTLGTASVAPAVAATSSQPLAAATSSQSLAGQLLDSTASVAPDPVMPTASVPQQKPATALSLLTALDAREAEKKVKKTQKDVVAAAPLLMKRPAAASSNLRAASKKVAAPCYAFERSRNQVMCRTGLGGPGSTFAIKYGKNEKCKTEAAAVAAAKAWLAQYAGA